MQKPALVALLSVICLPPVASAQETILKDAPVTYGHYHIYVQDVEAHKKFWGEALGGTATKLGRSTFEIVKIPNVIITLSQRAAPAQRPATTVHHIALQVRDIEAAINKIKAAGYPLITKAELPASAKVTRDIGTNPEINATVAFVQGPDDVKVELVENRDLAVPIALHHIHFAAQSPQAMRAWYVKAFGAEIDEGAAIPTAVLPRVRLLFSQATGPTAPTKGNVVDHIGFEIRELEKFTKTTQAAGIPLDRPYSAFAPADMWFSMMTDPWGTQIELTEGLP